jgi:hypothetical protein
VTVKIPSKYAKYVQAAADATGMPPQLVAAQIETESSWNPKAKSGAGAEGIAQFMPGTFKTYGPKGGSPYDVADAFAAYTAYMKALLKEEGGSIQKALEAYNAGPGNLGAGATYAHIILGKAGVPVGAKAGKSGENSAYDPNSGINKAVGAATSGLLDFPGEIVTFFKEGASSIEDATQFLTAFFQPSTYVRIGAGITGFSFLIIGLIALAMGAIQEN